MSFASPPRSLSLIHIYNIPMTRGLGSSSACIVGGLLGANTLLGEPLARDELVDMAAHLEGHPDNSTPAILGGFVSAVLEEEHVYYVKKELDEGMHFAACLLYTSPARRGRSSAP